MSNIFEGSNIENWVLENKYNKLFEVKEIKKQIIIKQVIYAVIKEKLEFIMMEISDGRTYIPALFETGMVKKKFGISDISIIKCREMVNKHVQVRKYMVAACRMNRNKDISPYIIVLDFQIKQGTSDSTMDDAVKNICDNENVIPWINSIKAVVKKHSRSISSYFHCKLLEEMFVDFKSIEMTLSYFLSKMYCVEEAGSNEKINTTAAVNVNTALEETQNTSPTEQIHKENILNRTAASTLNESQEAQPSENIQLEQPDNINKKQHDTRINPPNILTPNTSSSQLQMADETFLATKNIPHVTPPPDNTSVSHMNEQYKGIAVESILSEKHKTTKDLTPQSHQQQQTTDPYFIYLLDSSSDEDDDTNESFVNTSSSMSSELTTSTQKSTSTPKKLSSSAHPPKKDHSVSLKSETPHISVDISAPSTKATPTVAKNGQTKDGTAVNVTSGGTKRSQQQSFTTSNILSKRQRRLMMFGSKSTVLRPKSEPRMTAEEYKKMIQEKFDAMTVIPDEECIIPSPTLTSTNRDTPVPQETLELSIISPPDKVEARSIPVRNAFKTRNMYSKLRTLMFLEQYNSM